jgi:hypothetical protein
MYSTCTRIFLTFVKGTTIAYHTKLWTWRVFVWYAIVVIFTNVRKIRVLKKELVPHLGTVFHV